MPVDSTATTAIAYANTQVDTNILAKYTNAVDIQSTPYDKGWLYHIECRNPRTYDEFSEAHSAVEKRRIRNKETQPHKYKHTPIYFPSTHTSSPSPRPPHFMRLAQPTTGSGRRQWSRAALPMSLL
jgi:hypothetical protein